MANLDLPDTAIAGELDHIIDHNKIVTAIDAVNTALEAVETELGSNPSGSFSTVAERLNTPRYRLGNSSTAGAKTAITRYRHHAQKITVTGDSLLVAIEIYCDNTGGSPFNVTPGVWADNTATPGTPGRLLAVSGNLAENGLYWGTAGSGWGGPRWLSMSLTAELVAGDYWIGFMVHDSSMPDFGVYKTTGAANSSYYWLASGVWLTEGYTGVTGSTDLWSLRALLLR